MRLSWFFSKDNCLWVCPEIERPFSQKPGYVYPDEVSCPNFALKESQVTRHCQKCQGKRKQYIEPRLQSVTVRHSLRTSRMQACTTMPEGPCAYMRSVYLLTVLPCRVRTTGRGGEQGCRCRQENGSHQMLVWARVMNVL